LSSREVDFELPGTSSSDRSVHLESDTFSNSALPAGPRLNIEKQQSSSNNGLSTQK